MADEVQTPLNDGELEIMQPIDTSEPARVPAVEDGVSSRLLRSRLYMSRMCSMILLKDWRCMATWRAFPQSM